MTIQTETVQRVPVDFFGMFMGQTREQVSPGIGSGFIIRDNGVIVTNAHVVQGAKSVSVMMRDGTTYTAKVLGQDETNDVAVLKIDGRNMPVAPLGDSDGLLIGEWAIAIGNPFGFVLANSEPSVTAGVISATGRNLLGSSEGAGVYVDMIQTDASINPGNSGGPLVNSKGEVIGVNSSIYTPSQGSVGLGFAIPINRARRVAEDLIDHGEVRRPWVGELLRAPASGANPREAITAGAVLRGVVPGSPAANAGLRADDEIVRAGNRNVRNSFDWEAARLSFRVGERVPLVVRRGGREINVSVTIADRPEVSAPKVTVLQEIELTTLTTGHPRRARHPERPGRAGDQRDRTHPRRDRARHRRRHHPDQQRRDHQRGRRVPRHQAGPARQALPRVARATGPAVHHRFRDPMTAPQ